MKKFTEIERDNLVIGEKYYFDDKKIHCGIFKSRNKLANETVFSPIKNDIYCVDHDGFIRFNYDGDGFYPVI